MCRTTSWCSCGARTTAGPRTGTRCARTCGTTVWPTAVAVPVTKGPPLRVAPAARRSCATGWRLSTTRSRSGCRCPRTPRPSSLPFATRPTISSAGTTTLARTTVCPSTASTVVRDRSRCQRVRRNYRLPLRRPPTSTVQRCRHRHSRHQRPCTTLARIPGRTRGTRGGMTLPRTGEQFRLATAKPTLPAKMWVHSAGIYLISFKLSGWVFTFISLYLDES